MSATLLASFCRATIRAFHAKAFRDTFRDTLSRNAKSLIPR